MSLQTPDTKHPGVLKTDATRPRVPAPSSLHAGVQHHSVSEPVYLSHCKSLVPGHKEPIFDICSSPWSGSSGVWPGEVSIPPSTSAHSILPMGCSEAKRGFSLTVTGAEGRIQPVTQARFCTANGSRIKNTKKVVFFLINRKRPCKLTESSMTQHASCSKAGLGSQTQHL